MKYINKLRQLRLVIVLTVMGVFVNACTEEIDTSARFTLTEYTVLTYLQSDSDYTEYVRLLGLVPVSDFSESSVAQLLSARGKFTCFAPTNKAIYDYLDTLYTKGIITQPSWEGFTSDATLDSVYKVIVLNSIIDGSNSGDIYEMGDISSLNDYDNLNTSNLYDRKIYKTSITQTDSIWINGMALIDLNNRDVETINGRVHQVHGVIAPSNDTMADIIRQEIAEGQKGYLVMAKLILACGLEDTLSATQDDVWENLYLNKVVEDLPAHPTEQTGSIPRHRKYGFTIFAETDAFWEGVYRLEYKRGR